jgi:hypothetical protein
MSTSDKRRVVDALETAGQPLTRRELADGADLDGEAFDAILNELRGQQVVRYVPEEDAFRLTYWPEERDCVVCGDEIVGGEYYEIELREQATNTGSTMTGSLHTGCALDLLDDLSLEGSA